MSKWSSLRKVSSLLLGLLLLLAGCSGSKPADQNGQPVAPAPDRVVKHAMGETKVPANVKRVVVLDTGELDIVLALGIKPVGAVIPQAESEFPNYLKGKVDGIERVGTISEPNLETIAALRPDLILTNTLRHEKIYDKLSKIAPTVVGVRPNFWKDNLKLYAEALGKTPEAQKWITDYNQRLVEFKQKMGDNLGKTKVSIIRSMPDHARIYLGNSFSGGVLKDAGVPRPATQDKSSEDPAQFVFAKVTEEQIPDMDGDVIFALYYGREKGDSLARLFKSPLWSQLNAVKQNKVIEVDDGHWGLGLGPIAANRIVDDLFKYLVK
jgi:iron complex transport system substrate-binding protein